MFSMLFVFIKSILNFKNKTDKWISNESEQKVSIQKGLTLKDTNILNIASFQEKVKKKQKVKEYTTHYNYMGKKG